MEFRKNEVMTKLENKKCLVVTFGDSWTFGDSLGTINTNKKVDDYQARYTQVYGRLVADHYDADWINFGGCGWSNYPIIEKLYDLLVETQHSVAYFTYNIQRYDKVIVIVTLTETGRGVDEIFKSNRCSCMQYLEFEERLVYEKLAKLKELTNYTFVIGRNFTVDLPTTTNSVCNLPLNWVNVSYNYNAQNFFDNLNYSLDQLLISGPASGIPFYFLGSQQNVFYDFKKFFTYQMNTVQPLWKWLRNNPLHHSYATCHPTSKSHKVWSEYIISFLDQQK